ncbi:MAG: hypothetical protein Terrestrivirus3_155 [Terrestrivirus sp.]|uniref:Uncharacterized protein n=1 Tax=Terrestrivirus sp. TaxID=2487775 RepID=A0A3G4ZM15_9VIRU|nr:MAG: hypothetical protein Terrestrivirus3_155 [Terrestrivirus sp.]
MGNFLGKNENRICRDNINIRHITNAEYKLIDNKLFFTTNQDLLSTVTDKNKCGNLINILNHITKSKSDCSDSFGYVQFDPNKINCLTPVAYLCCQLNDENNSINQNIKLIIKFMIYNNFNNPKKIFVVDGTHYNELTYSLYMNKPNVTKMLLIQNESELLDTFDIALKEGYEDICQSVINGMTTTNNNICEKPHFQEIEPTQRFMNNYIKYCCLHNMQDLYIYITIVLLTPTSIQIHNPIKTNILNITAHYARIYNNYTIFISLILNFEFDVKTLYNLYENIPTNKVIKKILTLHMGNIYRQKLINKLDDSQIDKKYTKNIRKI